ncbi:MAG: carbohydrate kinase family protein, partial [Verrucomicrobia bacterium]|nr:carbohydrate kinase family protein [Verrucomicrobiota bacterium]
MSNRQGILAGGNWIVDAVKIIDTWPQEDALANILSESRGTGGSPFNVLVDLALMGAPFSLDAAGLVGEDAHGRYILDTCTHLGIRT